MKNTTKTSVTVNDKKVSLDKKDMQIVLSALNKAGYEQEDILAGKSSGVDIFYNEEYQTVFSRAPRVAEITINGKKASMLSKIKVDDVIVVTEPTICKENKVTLADIPGFNKNIEFVIDGREVSVLRMVELNKTLTFGDAQIKDGDVIFTRNYYTVGQLREVLDLDSDVVIVKDEEELDVDAKLYEYDEIETYVKAIYDRFVNGSEDGNQELLTGDDFTVDLEMNADANLGEEVTNEIDEIGEIKVMLNGEEVLLNNKKDYVVIDALDAQAFDTSILIGKSFSLKVNSEKANFATQICNNDVVELVVD